MDGDVADDHGVRLLARTPEGRLLCLLLAIYAFAAFGYVTAAIAAYSIDQDENERLA